MTKADNPIFVAIDTTDMDRARDLATSLRGHVGGIKLGLEFYLRHGATGIAHVLPEGLPLFLDMKLHDIPNTVAGAVRAVAPIAPALLTVHTAGGAEMMRRAVAAAREEAEKSGVTAIKLVGVTVLTSLSGDDLADMNISVDPATQVTSLALNAKAAGLSGIVCSPMELSCVRAACGADFLTIVPGIRPSGSEAGDQKRVMTPQQARRAGADILVIGRPITGSDDPVKAAKDILASLD